MNRILLQECLDELRSDDSVELTEGHKDRLGHKIRWTRRKKQERDKMRVAGQKGRIAIPGIQNQPTTNPSEEPPPTPPVDPNAEQKLAELAATIEQSGAKSQEDFLSELSNACGRRMGDIDRTRYFSNAKTGKALTLRLSNHRGNAESFKRHKEPTGNFGVVVKMKEQDFIPHDEVQYTEEVFFGDDLDAELEIGIVKGLIDWVARGQYTGPTGNQTFLSPGNGRPSRTRPPKNLVAGQSAASRTPPATPPTEPGVQESFFSRFSNLDYLYWILDEGKDRLIDRLPSLDDAQKAQMKQFFAKRPNLESRFDWNRPETITWDAFQSIANGYEDPIDPDTVPEFSNKRDEGDGIVSYEVQDDQDGQLAVRRIVDTHWGKKANPWCLITRGIDGDFRDELDGAWDYWEDYSSLPKRIAFKDGELLAFMATDEPGRTDYGGLSEEEAIDKAWMTAFPDLWKEYQHWLVSRLSRGRFQIGKGMTYDEEWAHFGTWLDRKGYANESKQCDDIVEKVRQDAWNCDETWWDRNDRPHPSVHDCVISTPRKE